MKMKQLLLALTLVLTFSQVFTMEDDDDSDKKIIKYTSKKGITNTGEFKFLGMRLLESEGKVCDTSGPIKSCSYLYTPVFSKTSNVTAEGEKKISFIGGGTAFLNTESQEEIKDKYKKCLEVCATPKKK